eukprot:02877.XXX_21624_21734_1 [CDS] Oithona nana genome sequencing.
MLAITIVTSLGKFVFMMKFLRFSTCCTFVTMLSSRC